jgi:hypothetical protein
VLVEPIHPEVVRPFDDARATFEARSTEIRDTAGPHIIPWPHADAIATPSTHVPSRSTSGPASGM